MENLADILQLVVGFSILVVWLVRSHVPTNFRVGDASTLKEEVLEVGLPDWFYDIIKIVKPIFAFFLLIGFNLQTTYSTLYGNYCPIHGRCCLDAHHRQR